MKILVLSTQTTHHSWFIKELVGFYPHLKCIVEEKGVKPRFATYHPYEDCREDFEISEFFGNDFVEIKHIAETVTVDSINDSNTFKPEIILVFGTRKITSPLLREYCGKILNLHGGDPELYRGLDSHLWAIYHEDFDSVVTTIHHLSEELDEGDIIAKQKLELDKISFLEMVRQRVKNDKALFLNVDSLVRDIFESCEITYVNTNDHPLDKKMTWKQVETLHSNPLFTIGGHTHSHAVMSFLDDNELDHEIDLSLHMVTKAIKQPLCHYSYPEGLEHCYNSKVISALKGRGIICSPTAIEGVNSLNADLFQLKRVMVI